MKLIGLKEAQWLIEENVTPLEPIQVTLQDGLGCVLASDVAAKVDSPSVDASLKDGFAVVASDLAQAGVDCPITLELVGRSTAGGKMSLELSSGQSISVTTGAPLPPQADAVVPMEAVKQENSAIRFSHAVTSGQDILPKGSDVARNQKVAATGDSVTPGLLGLLAAAGRSQLNVIRPPQVAIISTGDEVVAAGMPLSTGKLYASNLTTLDAWCHALGFKSRCLLVGDSVSDTRKSLEEVIGWADTVITSGGAWGSERDRVAPALENLHWQQIFQGVRMRPGKGAGFGLLDKKPIFMLPGGPSANLTAFLQLVLPGLQQMAGYHQKGLPQVIAKLELDVMSRHEEVSQFIFGKLKSHDNGYRFEPLNTPSRLKAMAMADALAVIPEGETKVLAGSQIRVQVLQIRCIG